MTKNEALEIAQKLTKGNIHYYMSNYAYDNKSNSKEWYKRLIEYIKNDYTGTEKTFRACADIFNKYYWFSYLNGGL